MRKQLQKIALNTLPISLLRKRLPPHPNINSNTDQKQLLIDVSAIAQSDAKTGIQRVVRNLYLALLSAPPLGFKIRPVAATTQKAYGYLPTDFLQHQTVISVLPIKVGNGDIFLGLDLSAHLIPHHLDQLWHWKSAGLRVSIVVYDLLPVLHPQWFNSKVTQNFHRWLRAIALLADSTITISRSVKTDFHEWMQLHHHQSSIDIPCDIIPLGSELDIGTNITQVQLPQQLAQQKFVLMVGTIEPRKGYADALDAFEKMWSTGNQTYLVIVGKHGWKTKSLRQRLYTHCELNKRLNWFDNADDKLLHTLYRHCIGVLITSKGEGYGLPIIEAIYFNKPVLARDLPVFREIAGNAISYFSNEVGQALTLALPLWLAQIRVLQTQLHCSPQHTWSNSREVLLQTLNI